MSGPPRFEPIGLQLARTAKAVSRAFDDALAGAGASVPTWLILASLKARRHGMQRSLAEAVGIEGATLTHHLNRMEQQGLVVRRRDESNRRVQQVDLTEEGEALFHRLRKVVVAFDSRLRAGFGESEMAEFSATLRRLRRNVAENAEEVSGD